MPTERKSARSETSSSCHSSEGTSTIAPSCSLARHAVAMPLEVGDLAQRQILGADEFIDEATIGEHDAQVAARAGTQQRPQLHTQQRRAIERNADGAPAERRILLLRLGHVGENLVGADVERAEGDRFARHRGEGGG